MKKTTTKNTNSKKESKEVNLQVQEYKDTINLVPVELNLKEEFVNLINSSFAESLKALSKYDFVYNLTITDEDDVETMKVAREARIGIMKTRTGGERIKDHLKKESLQYAKGVQSAFNSFDDWCRKGEEHCKGIENYKQIQEDKRKEAKKEERLKLIDPYIEFFPMSVDLKEMSDAEFSIFLNGLKLQLNEKIENERKENERKIIEELERQRILAEYAKSKEENEKLKRENQELKVLQVNPTSPIVPVAPIAPATNLADTDAKKFEVFRNKLLEVKNFLPTNLKEKANVEKLNSVRGLLNEVYQLIKDI